MSEPAQHEDALQCPACKQTGMFAVTVTATGMLLPHAKSTVFAEHVESIDELTWNHDTAVTKCMNASCGFMGSARKFYVPIEIEMPWVVGVTSNGTILRRFVSHDEGAAFISTLEGHEDGRYYLDGPEEPQATEEGDASAPRPDSVDELIDDADAIPADSRGGLRISPLDCSKCGHRHDTERDGACESTDCECSERWSGDTWESSDATAN